MTSTPITTPHQPRERAVPCAACTRPTLEFHGTCSSCGPGVCPRCEPTVLVPIVADPVGHVVEVECVPPSYQWVARCVTPGCNLNPHGYAWTSGLTSREIAERAGAWHTAATSPATTGAQS